MRFLVVPIISILLFSISGFIYSQPEEEVSVTAYTFSKGDDSVNDNQVSVNGYIWRGFREYQKEAYLLGYEDGVIHTALYYVTDKAKKEEIYSMLPGSQQKKSVREIVKKVDEFYSDDRNLAITLPYAVIVVRNKMLGVNDVSDSYVQYLRDNFGDDSKDIDIQSFGNRAVVKF